jgi:hypothetical protein
MNPSNSVTLGTPGESTPTQAPSQVGFLLSLVECRDMIEANKLTLLFYRQACRLLPAIINRQGNLVHMDYHKSKLNLAKWIRKSSNMRDPIQVTKAIRTSYDYLFACAYCDYESGYFNRFLVDNPERFDGSMHLAFKKSSAINLIDYNRFKNKSKFLQKFVKGVRPLMH